MMDPPNENGSQWTQTTRSHGDNPTDKTGHKALCGDCDGLVWWA